MYKTQGTSTRLQIRDCSEGETIEMKIRRITNNKEPISDGAPIIYTERKEGVKPEFNIRTDRWEIAVDAMDKVSSNKIAKREERHKSPDAGTDRGTDAPADTAA